MPADRETHLTRSKQGWLSAPEQWPSAWIAPQLPREVAPDLLTAPGFVAAIGLATYLMMTAQSLLRAEVSRTFHLASAGFGLTEVRCLFLALNVAFYLKPPVPLDIAGTSLGYGDIPGIAWIVVNLGLYLAGTIGQLSREEPPDGKDR